MVIRHFVHFPLLFIEKYRYGENRVANPEIKKSQSPYIGLKMPRILYSSKESPNLFF
jgi:hypothetical protein